MQNESTTSTASVLAYLIAGVAFIYLNAMFNHPPFASMEPRFAEVVHEMMDGHQYLIPIKNGVPYA